MSISNNFKQRVYQITAIIPKGKAATYGQIAALAGSPRASRIVGAIMAATPNEIDIPCHRVVYHDGTVCKKTTYDTVCPRQILLKEEGVPFKTDGMVDLFLAMWQPDLDEILSLDENP